MQIQTAISCLKKRVSYPLDHNDLLQLKNKTQLNIIQKLCFLFKFLDSMVCSVFFNMKKWLSLSYSSFMKNKK